MGACYYVNLKLKIRDEQGLIQALQNKISKADEERVNYSLDDYKMEGVGTETLDDLIRIFLAGWKCNSFHKTTSLDGMICYTNGFNASYGWESVMLDMCKIITTFLRDGSEFRLDVDNDYDSLVVRNGKLIQIH